MKDFVIVASPAPVAAPSAVETKLDSRGLLCGASAYLLWGLMPIYFRAVRVVSPLELLAHRALWSLLFLAACVWIAGKWQPLRSVLHDRRARRGLALTSGLIAANWLLFTWAVTTDRVIEASLGYFINPLVSVVLGAWVLRERPRRMQWVAIGIAALGVAVLIALQGRVPLLSLALALTFALYGLFRKQLGVDSLSGLTIETMLMTPVALGALLWWGARGELAFLHAGPRIDLLLLLAGVVTGIPLLLFGAAARRLPLTSLGLMQYLAPSLQFLLGLAFGEPMRPAQWLSFGLIWTGLAVFSAELVLRRRGQRGL